MFFGYDVGSIVFSRTTAKIHPKTKNFTKCPACINRMTSLSLSVCEKNVFILFFRSYLINDDWQDCTGDPIIHIPEEWPFGKNEF